MASGRINTSGEEHVLSSSLSNKASTFRSRADAPRLQEDVGSSDVWAQPAQPLNTLNSPQLSESLRQRASHAHAVASQQHDAFPGPGPPGSIGHMPSVWLQTLGVEDDVEGHLVGPGAVGPSSLRARAAGPGSLRAPAAGPGSLRAPATGPGSLRAPATGPGSLRTAQTPPPKRPLPQEGTWPANPATPNPLNSPRLRESLPQRTVRVMTPPLDPLGPDDVQEMPTGAAGPMGPRRASRALFVPGPIGVTSRAGPDGEGAPSGSAGAVRPQAQSPPPPPEPPQGDGDTGGNGEAAEGASDSEGAGR